MSLSALREFDCETYVEARTAILRSVTAVGFFIFFYFFFGDGLKCHTFR